MSVGEIKENDQPSDQQDDSSMEEKMTRLRSLSLARVPLYFFNISQNTIPAKRALVMSALWRMPLNAGLSELHKIEQ